MTNWMILTKQGEAAALAALLDAPESVQALVIGGQDIAKEAQAVAASVAWIPCEVPAENAAEQAADYLGSQNAQAVIGFATPGVRGTLGIFAARHHAAVIPTVTRVCQAEGGLSVEHTTVDGKVIQTLNVPVPACLLVDTLSFQPVAPAEGRTPTPLTTLPAVQNAPIELVDCTPIPASGVETAERVIGVGRGVDTKDKFDQAAELAKALGAEMSGSMPGVRDFDYFPEDAAYIGLSGVNLSANLYIALGISGSTPHLAGLLNAKRVVCINSDAGANLFDHADYGIVGDVAEVVPELIRAFK